MRLFNSTATPATRAAAMYVPDMSTWVCSARCHQAHVSWRQQVLQQDKRINLVAGWSRSVVCTSWASWAEVGLSGAEGGTG
jgi:hypothetical protein